MLLTIIYSFHYFLKGSRRNKFVIFEVEAPDRQDAEAEEYQAYFALPQRSRSGWIGVQNVKLFLSEPYIHIVHDFVEFLDAQL
jgi:hypothetical protein